MRRRTELPPDGVAEGDVVNQERRQTSPIAMLRQQWDLGDPVHAARRGSPNRSSPAFTLNIPRDPNRPCPCVGTA